MSELPAAAARPVCKYLALSGVASTRANSFRDGAFLTEDSLRNPLWGVLFEGTYPLLPTHARSLIGFLPLQLKCSLSPPLSPPPSPLPPLRLRGRGQLQGCLPCLLGLPLLELLPLTAQLHLHQLYLGPLSTLLLLLVLPLLLRGSRVRLLHQQECSCLRLPLLLPLLQAQPLLWLRLSQQGWRVRGQGPSQGSLQPMPLL